MKDALDETLILSDRIIQDLVSDIVIDIGALYKASEAVALLDMLWSFAHATIRELCATYRVCIPRLVVTIPSLVRNYGKSDIQGVCWLC